MLIEEHLESLPTSPLQWIPLRCFLSFERFSFRTFEEFWLRSLRARFTFLPLRLGFPLPPIPQQLERTWISPLHHLSFILPFFFYLVLPPKFWPAGSVASFATTSIGVSFMPPLPFHDAWLLPRLTFFLVPFLQYFSRLIQYSDFFCLFLVPMHSLFPQ